MARVLRVNTNIHVDNRRLSADPLAYGENDVEAVAELVTPSGRTVRVALLIEDKIDAPLMYRQGHRYRVRGKERAASGDWEDFRCIIVAPRERIFQLYPTDSFGVAGWDAVFTFEELAAVLAATDEHKSMEHAQLLMDATLSLNHFNEPILEAVRFWEDYGAYACEHHSDIPVLIKTEKGSRAGGVWPSFYEDEYRRNHDPHRKRIQIVHVDNASRVVLFLKKVTASDFAAVISPLLHSPMKPMKPGRSWQGVMIDVPGVDPCKLLLNQRTAVDAVFRAAKNLRGFFVRHESVIAQLVASSVRSAASPRGESHTEKADNRRQP